MAKPSIVISYLDLDFACSYNTLRSHANQSKPKIQVAALRAATCILGFMSQANLWLLWL